MSDKYDPICMAKSMAWERAKGELRSIVAAEGSRISGKFDKLTAIEEEVENFIKAFEEREFNL